MGEGIAKQIKRSLVSSHRKYFFRNHHSMDVLDYEMHNVYTFVFALQIIFSYRFARRLNIGRLRSARRNSCGRNKAVEECIFKPGSTNVGTDIRLFSCLYKVICDTTHQGPADKQYSCYSRQIYVTPSAAGNCSQIQTKISQTYWFKLFGQLKFTLNISELFTSPLTYVCQSSPSKGPHVDNKHGYNMYCTNLKKHISNLPLKMLLLKNHSNIPLQSLPKCTN